jgi:hypothetical protein
MKILDNLIALRIMWILITPFEKTDAFKLGLIDGEGNFIRKAKTSEEKNATSMLHRLVWRIKKFINMVPGGSTRIGSMVAAYALVRECVLADNYEADTFIIRESEIELSEEEKEIGLFIEQLLEDGIANVTGAAVSTDKPVIKKRAKGTFTVKRETFDKFKSGKTKFRRWGHYLNLDDDVDRAVYHYARKNPRGILVLQDEEGRSKGVRYSKHGGGNWHNIKRKPRDVVESYIENQLTDLEVIDL